MKNHEYIQSMNLEEMTIVFYYLIEPFLKTEEEKKKAKRKIRDFLNSEVKRAWK